MSEIKTWDMRAGKRWPEASEIIEAMQAEINELRKARAERDTKGKTMIDFKLQATGIPESIEQYQLALDAAFNAGKAIAAGAAPDTKGKTMIDFKLQATGIPESIEQYQLALDAAFNAGKAIAAPVPEGWRFTNNVDELQRSTTSCEPNGSMH